VSVVPAQVPNTRGRPTQTHRQRLPLSEGGEGQGSSGHCRIILRGYFVPPEGLKQLASSLQYGYTKQKSPVVAASTALAYRPKRALRPLFQRDIPRYNPGLDPPQFEEE
jgi:hypothetical protein